MLWWSEVSALGDATIAVQRCHPCWQTACPTLKTIPAAASTLIPNQWNKCSEHVIPDSHPLGVLSPGVLTYRSPCKQWASIGTQPTHRLYKFCLGGPGIVLKAPSKSQNGKLSKIWCIRSPVKSFNRNKPAFEEGSAATQLQYEHLQIQPCVSISLFALKFASSSHNSYSKHQYNDRMLFFPPFLC